MVIKISITKQNITFIGAVLEEIKVDLRELIKQHVVVNGKDKRFELLDRIVNLYNIEKFHLALAKKAHEVQNEPAGKGYNFSVDLNYVRTMVEEFKHVDSTFVHYKVFNDFLIALLKKV